MAIPSAKVTRRQLKSHHPAAKEADGPDTTQEQNPSDTRQHCQSVPPSKSCQITTQDPPLFIRSQSGNLLAGLKLEKLELMDGKLHVHGWLLGFPEVALVRDGNETPCQLSRINRPDVLALLPHNAFFPGFEISTTYHPQSCYALRWLIESDDKEIPVDFSLDTQSLESQNKLPLEHTDCHIDAINNFVIRGWCLVEGKSVKKLQLRGGTEQYDINFIRTERKDVSEGYRISDDHSGFEIFLPGHVWDTANENETIEISVLAAGTSAVDQFKLSRNQAAHWIEKIFALPEEKERQLLGLVALEHLRFGNLFDLLGKQTQKAVRDFASRFGLAAYLPTTSGNTPPPFAIDGETLLHWQALRVLNARLTSHDSAQDFLGAVRSVVLEEDLSGELLERFLGALVPQFCRHDILSTLRELCDPTVFLRHSKVSDAWALSTALPFLAEQNETKQATDLLWRLCDCLTVGWINTECIDYAVRAINRQFMQGRIEPATKEKFGYAVIGVLDKLRCDWFSRLFDENLIGSALGLAQTLHLHSDDYQRDVALALIRIYGLMPRFWQRAGDLAKCAAEPRLARAYGYWCDLAENKTLNSSCLIAIRFFLIHKNEDARQILRERILNTIAKGMPLDSVEEEAVRILFENSAEGIRLAAHPLVEEKLLTHFDETGPMLLETIRALTPRPKSLFWQLQRNIGRLLDEINKLARQGNISALEKPLSDLSPFSPLLLSLSNRETQFLAASLYAWAIALRRQAGLPVRDAEVVQVLRLCRQAIGETKADVYPPAPIFSALARLNTSLSKNLGIQAISQEIDALLSEHVGARSNTSPSHPEIPSQDLSLHADTLIVVYSCHKYLDTRIEAIRKTWITDLKSRGIPYLIIVGDGDDAIHGDTLALDVSDRYEDLPKKTLKLINWVLTHTDFQYLYKIDDDCFLDVENFFGQLTYRKHHYYGRVIQRGLGSMDRTWHQEKSLTPQARKTIDKSPEPSTYADGGGGYVLSRLAMTRITATIATGAGQRLLAVSLMEDKLVGDLLALSGIAPAWEDYESYQRRRTYGKAIPVGILENTFFPSQATPTVMTHLDTEQDQIPAYAAAQGTALLPKRIFPSYAPPMIDQNANQLELLSPSERLRNLVAGDAPLVIAVMRNELLMLRHFLGHYRQLGFGGFLIADNLSDDGTREALLAEPDVALFSADTEYKQSHYGVSWQQALLGNFCLGRWTLLADADELLVYPDWETQPISKFLAKVENEGANAIRLGMIDMYPEGDLSQADFQQSPPFSAAPLYDRMPLQPWRLGHGYYSNDSGYLSALRHRIDPLSEPNAFTSQKTALICYQSWMRLSEGLHNATGVRASQHLAWFAHFKYHAGFKDKVEAEIVRGQHFNNAKEYRRYQAMLSEGKWCFGQSKLSRHYESSTAFCGHLNETVENL